MPGHWTEFLADFFSLCTISSRRPFILSIFTFVSGCISRQNCAEWNLWAGVASAPYSPVDPGWYFPLHCRIHLLSIKLIKYFLCFCCFALLTRRYAVGTKALPTPAHRRDNNKFIVVPRLDRFYMLLGVQQQKHSNGGNEIFMNE